MAVSDGSCDYALPPEDVSSKSDSDTSEPEQKLLKFAADSQKHVRMVLMTFSQPTPLLVSCSFMVHVYGETQGRDGVG